ncbi:hypothetical protein CQY20_30745 [Mycolicibacterium agri]|uniref:Uncharacterized protein n=2 Tax=Mycolicibacterium agri TaxID=36811 RepID=A0A2A7MPH1_MYCAG|nr:hypothetical protein CQY20_30745 [Mycolicibacterium agri]
MSGEVARLLASPGSRCPPLSAKVLLLVTGLPPSTPPDQGLNHPGSEGNNAHPDRGARSSRSYCRETFDLHSPFQWRVLSTTLRSALKVHHDCAEVDTKRRFEMPGIRVADPKACQCGEVRKRGTKPWKCGGRHRLYMAETDRYVHRIPWNTRGPLPLRQTAAGNRRATRSTRLKASSTARDAAAVRAICPNNLGSRHTTVDPLIRQAQTQCQ